MSRAAVLGDNRRRRGRSRAIKALPNIVDDAQPTLSSPPRATPGRRFRFQTRIKHHYLSRHRPDSKKGSASSSFHSVKSSPESAASPLSPSTQSPHWPSISPPSPVHRSSTPCAANDYHLVKGTAQPIDTPTRRPCMPPPHPTIEAMELCPNVRRLSHPGSPPLELDDAWHCGIDLDPDQHLEEQPSHPLEIGPDFVSIQCVTQDLDSFVFDSEVEEEDKKDAIKPQRGRHSSVKRNTTSRAPDSDQRSISASRRRRRGPGHSRASSESTQGDDLALLPAFQFTQAREEQASDDVRFFGDMSGPINAAQGNPKPAKDGQKGYARQRSSTVGLLSPINMTRVGPLRNSSPGEQRRQQHSFGPSADSKLYPDTPFIISGLPAAAHEHSPPSSHGTPLPSPILHYARVASSTASTESLPLAPRHQHNQQVQGGPGHRRKTISFALAPGTNPDAPRLSKVGKSGGRALSRAATQRHGQQNHSRYQDQNRREVAIATNHGQVSWTDSWSQRSDNGVEHTHSKVVRRRDCTGSGFSTPSSCTISPGLSPIRSRPPPQSNSAAMATNLLSQGSAAKKGKVRGGSVSSTTSLESLPWIRHLEGGPPAKAGGHASSGKRSRQTSFNSAWAFSGWIGNKADGRRGAVDVTPPSEEVLVTRGRFQSEYGQYNPAHFTTGGYKAAIGAPDQGQDEAVSRVPRPSFHHRACSSDQVLPTLSKVSALASTTTAVSSATSSARNKKKHVRPPSASSSTSTAAGPTLDNQGHQEQSTGTSSTFLSMFGHQGRPRSQSDLTVRLKGTLDA